MGELEHLLDADTGVAEHLDNSPGPEAVIVFESEVAAGATTRRDGVDHAGTPGSAPGRIGDDRHPLQALLADLEASTCWSQSGGIQQISGVATPTVGGLHQGGQGGSQFPDALVHAGGRPLPLLVLSEHVPATNRVGHRPDGPAAGIFEGPGGQVGVEGADRHEDGVGVLPEPADMVVAVADVAESLLPPAGHVVCKVQGIDAWFVELQVPPEQQHQLAGQLAQ